MALVYTEVMIKCKRCMVRAKSGTSFDRDTSRSSGITLAQVSFDVYCVSRRRSIREESDQQPDNSYEPTKGAVAFDVVPIKH